MAPGKKKVKKVELSAQQKAGKKAAATRRRLKVALTILTLLCVELLIDYIFGWVRSFDGIISPYLITLLGMIVVVVLLYGVIQYINYFASLVFVNLMEVGRFFLGKKRGITVSFVFLFVILYSFYHWSWFGTFPHEELLTYLAKKILG